MKRLSAIAAGLLVIVFTVSGCATSSQSDGWVTLFDGASTPTGASLDGWNRVGDAQWHVLNGSIETSKGNGFLVSKDSYKDFQLRAEFWVSNDANSGIFIRCTDAQKIGSVSAYEVNIFDTRPDPSYGTGAIVSVAKVSPMPKAGGTWNTMEISAKGSRLTVWFNGVRTVDANDSKFPSGPIALQGGGGVIKFRKVQIKPL